MVLICREYGERDNNVEDYCIHVAEKSSTLGKTKNNEKVKGKILIVLYTYYD